MNKDTKITLDALLARKEQSKEDKNMKNRRELYIPSLDGTITIKPPTRATISEAKDADNDALADMQ